MFKFRIPTTVKKEKPESKITIFHVIFLTPIFVIIFGFGLWSLGDVLDLKMRGTEADATVTAVSISQNDDGENQYTPTFEFYDQDQVKHQKTAGYSTSTHYAEGQEIQVLYLKKDPAKTARINYWMDLWLMPLMLLMVGAFGEFGIIVGYQRRLAQKSRTHTQKTTNLPDLSSLLNHVQVTSRYWQTVREKGQKKLEVQYVYENTSYKTRSQPLTDKQLKKLVPGEEITLMVNRRSPEEAVIMI